MLPRAKVVTFTFKCLRDGPDSQLKMTRIAGRTALHFYRWEWEGASTEADGNHADLNVWAHKHTVHTYKDGPTQMLNKRPVCDTLWLNWLIWELDVFPQKFDLATSETSSFTPD